MSMYIAGTVTSVFLTILSCCLRHSLDNHALCNLLRDFIFRSRVTCLLQPGRFFLFSPLCSVRGRTGEPGEGVMDTYHRVCQLAPPICSIERY